MQAVLVPQFLSLKCSFCPYLLIILNNRQAGLRSLSMQTSPPAVSWIRGWFSSMFWFQLAHLIPLNKSNELLALCPDSKYCASLLIERIHERLHRHLDSFVDSVSHSEVTGNFIQALFFCKWVGDKLLYPSAVNQSSYTDNKCFKDVYTAPSLGAINPDLTLLQSIYYSSEVSA